jgi:hypothetical protein
VDGVTRFAGLFAVALALRLAFFAWSGGTEPFGEDAGFWGYRALELADGRLGGSHPPAYPALLALGVPATALSLVAGAAGPPLLAWAVEAHAGLDAGRRAGWLALLLPDLTAMAARVEPTTLLVACLALVLRLAARPGWIVGVAAAALVLVKENALPLALGVPLAMALRDRRPHAVVAAVATLGALAALDHGAGEGGVVGKLALPGSQVAELLARGVVPFPVLQPEISALRLHAGLVEAIHAGPAAVRAALFSLVQAQRLAVFAGLWLPVAAAALWRARRQPAGPFAWALTLPLVAVLPVVFQARHVEVGLLGGVVALAVAGPPRWLVAGLAGQAVGLLALYEAPRAQVQAACAREEVALAEGLRGRTPVCSSQHAVGYRLGRLVRDCAGKVPAGEAWFVEREGDLRAFTRGELANVVTVTIAEARPSACGARQVVARVRP